MEDAGRNFVKWTLAIIVLAGVVAYALQEVGDAFRSGIAFGDDAASEDEDEGEPDSGEPVVNGEVRPATDFALIDNVVQALGADGMVVGPGPGDAAVVSFPLIPGDPDCIETVEITMGVREATPTDFAVYPSALVDLAPLTDGTPAPVDPVIPVEAPPVASTDGTPGALIWNVTEMYRTWATGGSFGDVPAPAAGTPFTVVVKPPVADDPARRVLFGTGEAVDPPLLRWTGITGCGAEPAAEA